MVTGVSGSGKSTLVNDILYRALAAKLVPLDGKARRRIARFSASSTSTRWFRSIRRRLGARRARIPPPTAGVFAPIRELFAMLPESRERGYKPGRFSFNVKGGRCEACQGDGRGASR